MTLQIIRRDGRVKGFAFFFGEARVIVMGEPREELWRICEGCLINEALVFCRTHTKYLCGDCLAKQSPAHRGCEFISMAVARDLADRAQQYAVLES